MGASQSSISPATKVPGRCRSIKCSSTAAKATPPAVEMASSKGRRPDSTALEADQTQLEELAAAYGEGKFSLAEWLAARTPIETRITTARKRLSRLTNTTVLDGYIGDSTHLRTLWDDLTISRQQAIIKSLLDHLTIAPSPPGHRRFNTNRITPTWKH